MPSSFLGLHPSDTGNAFCSHKDQNVCRCHQPANHLQLTTADLVNDGPVGSPLSHGSRESREAPKPTPSISQDSIAPQQSPFSPSRRSLRVRPGDHAHTAGCTRLRLHAIQTVSTALLFPSRSSRTTRLFSAEKPHNLAHVVRPPRRHRQGWSVVLFPVLRFQMPAN